MGIIEYIWMVGRYYCQPLPRKHTYTQHTPTIFHFPFSQVSRHAVNGVCYEPWRLPRPWQMRSHWQRKPFRVFLDSVVLACCVVSGWIGACVCVCVCSFVNHAQAFLVRVPTSCTAAVYFFMLIARQMYDVPPCTVMNVKSFFIRLCKICIFMRTNKI